MSKFTLFHFVSLNAKAGICNKKFFTLWHQMGRQD